MNRPCNNLSFQQVQSIEFTNKKGVHMQIILEPFPKRGSYFSGRATFIIGSDEIMGTHYWPNLAVELIEHKAFSRLDKFDLATDIEDVREHIKVKYAEEIKRMPEKWHTDFNDAFDDWSGMRPTIETLFFTDNTSAVLSELLGDDWQEYDIIPKTKNRNYVLVKNMITEFQMAMRGEIHKL